jgi:hypothetical protein
VITVRLAHTAAEYAASGNAFWMISDDLAAVAPAGPTEKTVLWINAGSGACGESGSSLVVMFEAACGIHPSAFSRWPAGGTYLLAHEMTHSFGAVASCAPHWDGTGHVNDDPRDVLYQGSQARAWSSLILDPGHDDYYATGRTDCGDIAASPFWTKTSAIGS